LWEAGPFTGQPPLDAEIAAVMGVTLAPGHELVDSSR